MDTIDEVHADFARKVDGAAFPKLPPITPIVSANAMLEIFRSQCLSRHLDRTARAMQRIGQGYYTIGSSGHEGMSAVAACVTGNDPAFLHYRDCAFQIQRAADLRGPDHWEQTAYEILLSFAASSEDPISGGRHKVLGAADLNIAPQTSTIASHLPKAVGTAFGISLSRRVAPLHGNIERDAIVLCSFGDASANHSTAQGAFNTAGWASFKNNPMPILFVCEDNGIGISVRSPEGWIKAMLSSRPGVSYFHCNGLDLVETLNSCQSAVDFVRRSRKPAILHMRTVRLFGHAGSDVESAYREPWEIVEDLGQDPLLASASRLLTAGVTKERIIRTYLELGEMCEDLAPKAAARPKLGQSSAVARSLIPPPRAAAQAPPSNAEERRQAFGKDIEAMFSPQPMARLLNWALGDLMLRYRHVIIAGEDVGRKGGVYGVTRGLQKRFGRERVIDTILDEQSILGLGIGLGQQGYVPVPEIQFLAYLHNAQDQIRGEAATLPFFSDGQFTNPMVVRIAGLGYQRGFGGHFHNDNSLAVLRDIPGIVIACPSNGADAARMLRGSFRLADEQQRVVVFVEPIALYQTRDLHEYGDGAWLSPYPEPDQTLMPGELGIFGEGRDVAIVSYGNGFYLARKAAKTLLERGIEARVIDLRWLAPLAEQELLDAVADCASILIVDECRKTGSLSEALIGMFTEAHRSPIARVTGDDCFIATGPAFAAGLPSVHSILHAAQDVFERATAN
ncbi:thiamine pyrophosphate-dependent enzyme [Algicella marina]|uniref:2-oxoglutarate dehydrogenase E1 component n=1 Tax=Algicella marina TaxID=2683284 RepID=A0A6P1T420_9RHOB|nr:thiamine pyrophosphate-dependent enzyme [Algicella marina]QHQ35272.1 MFS transporter [Algicella marina]